MQVKPLEEKAIDLEMGERRAVATLWLFENGWVIHSIVGRGHPDLRDSDNAYQSLDEARIAAYRMWSARL